MKSLIIAGTVGLFFLLISITKIVSAHEIAPGERRCLIKRPDGKGEAFLIITPSKKRAVDGLHDDMPLIREIYIQSTKGKRLYTLFNEQRLDSPVAKAVYLENREYVSNDLACPNSQENEHSDVINDDINFDGYYDVAIIHIHEYNCCRNPQYDTWIYDPLTSKYVYNKDYSSLTLNQLHLYSEQKIVVAGSVGGACLYTSEAYKYEGNKLKALYAEQRSDCGNQNGFLYTVIKPDKKGHFIENQNIIRKERRTDQQKTLLEDMLNLGEASYTNYGGR